jgi:hypothetical protein
LTRYNRSPSQEPPTCSYASAFDAQQEEVLPCWTHVFSVDDLSTAHEHETQDDRIAVVKKVWSQQLP